MRVATLLAVVYVAISATWLFNPSPPPAKKIDDPSIAAKARAAAYAQPKPLGSIFDTRPLTSTAWTRDELGFFGNDRATIEK